MITFSLELPVALPASLSSPYHCIVLVGVGLSLSTLLLFGNRAAMGRPRAPKRASELYDMYLRISQGPQSDEYRCPNASCMATLKGTRFIGRRSISAHLSRNRECGRAWWLVRKNGPPPLSTITSPCNDNPLPPSSPSDDDDSGESSTAPRAAPPLLHDRAACLDDYLARCYLDGEDGLDGQEPEDDMSDLASNTVDEEFLACLTEHLLKKKSKTVAQKEANQEALQAMQRCRVSLDTPEEQTVFNTIATPNPGQQPYSGVWQKVLDRQKEGYVDCDLNREELHLLKLLHMLKGYPLYMFDKIIQWVMTANQDGVFLHRRNSTCLPSRKSLIEKFRRRKGMNGFVPQQTPVDLKYSKISVPVTTFDIEEVLISLFRDKDLMKPENLATYTQRGEAFDLFAPPLSHLNFDDLPDDYEYGDFNTGRICVESYRTMVSTQGLDLPVGVILAVDKTHLDVHGRCMLEPVMLSLTLFNRKARQNANAWRVIGFIPNFNPLRQPKDPCQKNHDYHQVVDHVLTSLHNLMSHRGGFYWVFDSLGVRPFPAAIKLYLHSILGDHEGHDKAVCHFTNRSLNVTNLCRLCNTPTDRFDDPEYQNHPHYRLLSLQDITTREGAAKHSFRFLDDIGMMFCGYAKLYRGVDHERYGVNHRTIIDILHDVLLGDFKTCHNCFVDVKHQSAAVRRAALRAKNLKDDDVEQSLPSPKPDACGRVDYRLFSPKLKRVCERAMYIWGVCLTHQSDRGLPRVFFPQGAMSTEKLNARDYAGLILLDLLLLCSTLGDFLFGDLLTAREAEDKGYRRLALLGDDKIDSWMDLFDKMLLMDAFERSEFVTERYRKRYGQFLLGYSKTYKTTLDKHSGNGMKKIKFHSKTHRADQIRNFGVSTNGDTEKTEQLHRDKAKMPGKNTQKRYQRLDQQSGKMLADNTIIDVNYAEQRHILEPRARRLAPQALCGSSYRVELISQQDGVGRCLVVPSVVGKRGMGDDCWEDSTLQRQIENFFWDHVRPRVAPGGPVFPIPLRNSFHHTIGGDPKIFRAEPGKTDDREGCTPGWNDWAFVSLPRLASTPIPAHLLSFFELQENLAEEFFLHEGCPSVGKAGHYVLCHLASHRAIESVHEGACRIVSRLTKDYLGDHLVNAVPTKKNRTQRIKAMKAAPENLTLYVLPVTCIVDCCIAVPDIFPEERRGNKRGNNNFVIGDAISPQKVEFLLVENSSTWQSVFENLLDEEGLLQDGTTTRGEEEEGGDKQKH